MKLYIILAVAITLFVSLVNALAVRYNDMSDFDIARMFIKDKSLTSSAGGMYIIYLYLFVSTILT